MEVVSNLFSHRFVPFMHIFRASKCPLHSYNAHTKKLQVEMIFNLHEDVDKKFCTMETRIYNIRIMHQA